MSTGKSILVLGAGELGMAVLSALAAKNQASKVTVMLRPPTIAAPSASKAQDLAVLRSKGIDVLGGDISASTVQQLADLFQPFHTIISCTGYAGGGGAQTKIAEAVLAARVARFVPWQFGVDYDVIGRGGSQDLFDEQLDVRDLLRAQNATEWIIISTGIFMSFMFATAWGMIDVENGVVRGFGKWSNRITATTAEDIGILTAEVIFTEPRIKNQVIFVAGETINYEQLANIVDKVRRKQLKRELWTLERLKQELREEPNDVLRKYRVVWADGRGVAWDLAETFNAKAGIRTTSIEQHAHSTLG